MTTSNHRHFDQINADLTAAIKQRDAANAAVLRFEAEMRALHKAVGEAIPQRAI